MALTEEQLKSFQVLDLGKARSRLQELGVKNPYEGGGAFTQIEEYKGQLETSLGDLANPNITSNQRQRAIQLASESAEGIQNLQNIVFSQTPELENLYTPVQAINPDVPGLGATTQSFADVRAAGDPNDYILIEKNGKQRRILRSNLSPGFEQAGFKIVGETGAKKAAAPVQTDEPNFIAGLNEGQKQSIRDLVASRPSSQWSETDLANWNYATGGQALPSGFPTTQPTGDITPDSFEVAEEIKVPGVAGTPITSDTLIAGAKMTVAELMKALTPPETATDKAQQDLLDNMANLVGEQAQKAADQLTAEQSAGLPELRQQYADINSQILTRIAEYEALKTEREGKPVTMNTIIGEQAQIEKAKASEIGLLQAQALGLQGQIETAQATVDRAIDLKYSAKEAQLAVYEAQLNALMPTLNKEEKTQALAQQLILDERTRELEEQKEEEKNVQSVLIDYISSGGTDTNVMEQIKNATSYTNAIEIYGANVPEGAAELDTQVVTAGGRQLLINTQTGETIRDLGSAYKATGTGVVDEIPTNIIEATDYVAPDLSALKAQGTEAFSAVYEQYVSGLLGDWYGGDEGKRGQVESLVNQAIERFEAPDTEIYDVVSDFEVSEPLFQDTIGLVDKKTTTPKFVLS